MGERGDAAHPAGVMNSCHSDLAIWTPFPNCCGKWKAEHGSDLRLGQQLPPGGTDEGGPKAQFRHRKTGELNTLSPIMLTNMQCTMMQGGGGANRQCQILNRLYGFIAACRSTAHQGLDAGLHPQTWRGKWESWA